MNAPPRPSMTRQAIDALDDALLVRAAVEPIIVAVRAKSPAIKSAVYEALSPERRALFMFWIVFSHAGEDGWTRFFREVSYLYALPRFFDSLRAAFEYIGDDEMLALVGDVEEVHRVHAQVMEQLPTLGPGEPMHDAVIEMLAPLDRRYITLVEGSLRRLASRIRARASDFVAVQG